MRGDEKLLRHYVEYMRLASDLRFGPRNDRLHDVMARLFDEVQGSHADDDSADDGSAVELPNHLDNHQSTIINQQSTIAPIILDLSPAFHSPLFALHSPVGGFVFSYLTAALLLGIGLMVGLAWRITRDQQVVEDPGHRTPAVAQPVPETPLVGRVTGAVDCRWADPKTEAFDRDGVSLGRKFALASGFLEITYDTGAKVILQGPCRYEVESPAGGYLSLGKLTARVKNKGSGSKGERTANLALARQEREPTISLAPPPSAHETREEKGEKGEGGRERSWQIINQKS